MSDIQEEQKKLYKRAEENDKEQVCLKASIPLFEEKELEIFDNNIHSIIEEYSKLHLEKKEQILTQRIIIKQEQEINRLNNIIDECANEILKELQENHHLSYGVALAIRQKLINYNELKGDNK